MTVARFLVYHRIFVLNSVKIQKNSIEFYMILCYDTIQSTRLESTSVAYFHTRLKKTSPSVQCIAKCFACIARKP